MADRLQLKQTQQVQIYSSSSLFRQEAEDKVCILLSIADRASFEFDRKRFNLGYGDFFILNKPDLFQELTESKDKFLFITLQVEGYNKKLIYQKERLAGNSALNGNQKDVEMKSLLVRLVEEYYRQEHFDLNALHACYYELVGCILHNYFTEEQAVVTGFDSKEDELFFQIISFVDENFRQHISLNDIAGQFYLSPSYLSKFFKKKTGKKFLAYVTERRLQAAEVNIRYSNEPVIQIALDNGFPNVASFNKAFKEKFGETPAKYRKEQQLVETDTTESELPDSVQMFLEQQHEKESFQKEIQVDVTQVLSENPDTWRYLINLGSAHGILQYGFKEQLMALQKSVTFKYGRFWGLFDDKVLFYESGKRKKINFRSMDEVIELLLSNGLIPFIELGDKPYIINRSTQNRVFSEGHVGSYFFEREDWQWILQQFIRHIVDKWGREEVSRWKFELWKPNLTVLFDDEKFMRQGNLYEEEAKRYVEQFAQVHQLIKRSLPLAELGGCGLSVDLERKYIQNFITQWSQAEVKPDFFSIYLYPMNPVRSSEESLIENHISPDKAYFVKMIEQVREILEKTSFQGMPLLITEWNFSISNRNYLHDTCYKAAFAFKAILESMDKVAGLGYWLLSDLYGDFGDTNELIHGGAGLVTKDNIKKPVFYVFEFLSQMGSHILYKDRGILITKDEDDVYSILMSNYKYLNNYFFLLDEVDVDSTSYTGIFEDTLPVDITIIMEGLEPADYRIKSQTINQESGSVANNVRKIGDGTILRKEEVNYLKNISMPFLEVKKETIKADCMEVTSHLLENELRLVTLEKLY